MSTRITSITTNVEGNALGRDSTFENFQQQTFVENTDDNIGLFIRRIVSSQFGKSNPKKRILFTVHGFGEHSGRYLHLPRYLENEFDVFYFFDLRGHGRSAGLRGDAPSVDCFVADLEMVFERCKQDFSKQVLSSCNSNFDNSGSLSDKSFDWVLLGHSFGGLISLLYLLDSTHKKTQGSFTKAVISAPLLGLKLRVPEYKKVLAKLLLRTLPRLQLSNEVNPSFLSHDLNIVEKYIEDRLVHHKVTPRLYASMVETFSRVQNNHGPLITPTLFLVPTDDHVVDPKATLAFFHNLKDDRKKLKEFLGMYHEVFNEIEKESVFKEVTQWL